MASNHDSLIKRNSLGIVLFIPAFILLLQTVGAWVIEFNGRILGMPNFNGPAKFVGMTLGFLCFISIMFLTTFFARRLIFKSSLKKCKSSGERTRTKQIRQKTATLLMVFLTVGMGAIFFITYTFLGGAEILGGELGRGAARRIDFLPGPMPRFIQNYIPKVMFCAGVIIFFLARKKSFFIKLSFFALTVATISVAATTGFKASVILYVAPGATIYFVLRNYQLRVPALLLYAVVAVLMIFSFARLVLPEASDWKIVGVFERATMPSSSVTYYFWEHPYYWENTYAYLSSQSYIFGGPIVSRLFVSDLHGLVNLNWSYLITTAIGYPVESVIAGHTSTGSILIDGGMLGGYGGIALIAVFLGLFGVALAKLLARTVVYGRWALSMILCLYIWNAWFGVFNGGGIYKIFNLAMVLDYFILYCLIVFLMNSFGGARLRPQEHFSSISKGACKLGPSTECPTSYPPRPTQKYV